MTNLANDQIKPFTYEKFVAAMLKLEKLRQNFVSAQADFWREVQNRLIEPKYKERFVIEQCGGIRLIKTKQIAYFQIQDGILFALDAEGNRFPLNEISTISNKFLIRVFSFA